MSVERQCAVEIVLRWSDRISFPVAGKYRPITVKEIASIIAKYVGKAARGSEAQIEEARALCQKFVDKVDSGRAKSRETYSECQHFLETVKTGKQNE